MVTGDRVKDAGDTAAILAGVAVWMQWIPVVVGLVTIVYTVWRFIEALDVRRRYQQWPFAAFGSPGTEARRDAKSGDERGPDKGDGGSA